MLFIPRIASAIPLLRASIDFAARRRGCESGMDGVDWGRVFWTPPLAPRQAFELEANQLSRLGLAPLVSLTDHDDISAPVHLNALPELAGHVPISVEWSRYHERGYLQATVTEVVVLQLAEAVCRSVTDWPSLIVPATLVNAPASIL